MDKESTVKGQGDDPSLGRPDPKGARPVAAQELAPSPYQPRRRISEDSLLELRELIRHQGVVVPILVREVPTEFGGAVHPFQIIDGERRWRAAMLEGLEHLPCTIYECDDRIAARMTFVANLGREDVSAIDQARALQWRCDEFKYTHAKLAAEYGMTRVRVTTLISLLRLPSALYPYFDDRSLTAKHGEQLLRLDEATAIRLGTRAAEERWSARRLEQAVQRIKDASSRGTLTDPNVEYLENALAGYFGAKVKIAAKDSGRKGGSMTIEFYSNEELDGLLERMGFREDL